MIIYIDEYMKSLTFRRISVFIIFTLLSNVFVLSVFTQQTQAATNLTQASMVLYRMGVSRTTSTTDPILIIAKPATAVATASQVKISFASGFSPLAATVIVTTAAVLENSKSTNNVNIAFVHFCNKLFKVCNRASLTTRERCF
jgi:hypothetical protein